MVTCCTQQCTLPAIVQRWIEWLKPTRLPLMIFVITFVLPIAGWAAFSDDKHQVLWVKLYGLGIQLVGFGTVWWQIRATLGDYGKAHWWARFVAWASAPPWQRRNLRMQASGASYSVLAGHGSGRHGRAPHDGTIESRIALLESMVNSHEQQIETIRADHGKTAAELRKQIAAERAERAAAHTKLSQQVMALSVGSSDLQTLGLLWFVWGGILATIPEELTRWAHCIGL